MSKGNNPVGTLGVLRGSLSSPRELSAPGGNAFGRTQRGLRAAGVVPNAGRGQRKQLTRSEKGIESKLR